MKEVTTMTTGASTTTTTEAEKPSTAVAGQKPPRHKRVWGDIETARLIELAADGREVGEIARLMERDADGVTAKIRRILKGAQPCPEPAQKHLPRVRELWDAQARPAAFVATASLAGQIKKLLAQTRAMHEQNGALTMQTSLIEARLRQVTPMTRLLLALAVCRGELAVQEAARFLGNPAEGKRLAETVAEIRTLHRPLTTKEQET